MEDEMDQAGKAILKLVAEINSKPEKEDAQPQVDPNLVRIAEQEAQVKVYESVIDSAGTKLGTPKKQVKSASNRGKE